MFITQIPNFQHEYIHSKLQNVKKEDHENVKKEDHDTTQSHQKHG